MALKERAFAISISTHAPMPVCPNYRACDRALLRPVWVFCGNPISDSEKRTRSTLPLAHTHTHTIEVCHPLVSKFSRVIFQFLVMSGGAGHTGRSRYAVSSPTLTWNVQSIITFTQTALVNCIRFLFNFPLALTRRVSCFSRLISFHWISVEPKSLVL